MSKKYFNIIFLILVFCAVLLLSDESVSVMKRIFTKSDSATDQGKPVIVIDAGHGGFDPGKIGVNDAKEKDVNLAIAKKLKSLLELNDFKVVMTRETDEGLYSETDKKKKSADMRNRVELIRQSNAILAVSIHQNSFTDSSSSGAQVFYYTKSAEGKVFGETIQETIKSYMKDENHRLAKANDSYYMLKKSACPLVIVECGFLSNAREADLLVTEEYQEKMAWAIHLGIIQYYNTRKSSQ